MKRINYINLIFFSSLTLVCFIALGLIPRQFAFLIASAYLIYAIFAPLENSVSLFLRSIPFFIALPITASFDNFNTWRIILFAIFVKWTAENIKYQISNIGNFWKEHRVEFLGIILFIIAFFSLVQAANIVAGIKRIIYFINLAMIFIVIKSLISKNKNFAIVFSKNILIGGAILIGFGYLQLLSVYFIPIDVWHQWWGRQVSLGFYGKNWSDIAMQGNTWFSYTAESLKLRMFSVFPDSHSFPIYLLMIIPAFFAFVFHKYGNIILSLKNIEWHKQIKQKLIILKKERRALDWLIFVFLLSFALILSGTRGIWISVVFPTIFGVMILLKYKSLSSWLWPCLKIIAIFLILFPIASFLWSFPQFQLKTGGSQDRVALAERVKSSFNIEETSNMGRIYIWKETLKSLAKKPLFGVGIGNYPLVLGQNILLARAGSSAHNLYLTVAAEIGIAGGIIFLWFLFEILRSAWKILKKSEEPWLKIFGISSIIFLLWVFGYSLTDAALFDERAFLIFMGLAGMVIGINNGQNFAKGVNNFSNPSQFKKLIKI